MEKNYYAGAISGLIEVVTTHPIDYIKTKRQEFIQNNLSTKNFIRKIYKNNIFNFYTGMSSRLIGIIPMRLTFWGVQSNINNYLKFNSINNTYNFLIIGSIGGFFQTILDNQIELYKISKITNKKITIKNLIKNDGFIPTLYRNIGFANFISYVCFNDKYKTDNNFTKFYYSSFAGLIGSFTTQPFDFIKTIKQSNYSKQNEFLKNLSTFKILIYYCNKNPKILFTGGLYRCILSFFTMGIGFVAYDNLLKIL
tara:strand:+ start:78 stop:836 length:759 start_codon:yes stop_codon:yes gene_type:complete